MTPYQYTISLRIWHPSLSHAAISEAIPHPPRICWTVGDLRCSPNGKPLGPAKTTYWMTGLSADSVLSDPVAMEQALKILVDELTPFTAFFTNIRIDGGKAEIFVGLFSANNLVLGIEPSLMVELAKCGLSICLDFYPWDRYA